MSKESDINKPGDLDSATYGILAKELRCEIHREELEEFGSSFYGRLNLPKG